MAGDGGISVLIVTRGRAGLLAECLRSFSACPPDEVVVGVDGQDPSSAAVLADFPGVKALQLPRSCRGEARNALAAAARGRWLCFLDDDVVLPEGYFGRLRALIAANPGCAVFGGGQTLYPGAARFETAVYALLASRWGAGPFTERFSPVTGCGEAAPEKFILCNLTVDSDFLRRRGLAFEGHLTSAEENLLLNRMAAAGARMLLCGDLNLAHRRRTGLPAFARQVFSSGRGRGQITALSPRGFSAFTLLPPGALLLAVWAAAGAPRLLAAGAALYLAACAAAAAKCGAPERGAVFALYPVLHAAYALGWLWGLGEELAEKLSGRSRPRRCRCAGRD